MTLLTRALRANGLYSTVAGAVLVLASVALAESMEVSPVVLNVVGVGVISFGLAILWLTRSVPVNQGFALGVIAADVSWVIGALMLMVIPGLFANKWLLALVSLPVATFAVLQTAGLRKATEMTPRRMETEVVIDSPRRDVWAAVAGLDGYGEWNPFVTEAAGLVAEGEKLDLKMEPPGGTAIRFKPSVTEVRTNESLEWLGHLGPKGMFDGRHRFELKAEVGGTRLLHSEEFTGILVPLFWRSLDTKTRAGFELMNQALKERVEETLANSG